MASYYTLDDLSGKDCVCAKDLYSSFRELDDFHDDLIESYSEDRNLDTLDSNDPDFVEFAAKTMDQYFEDGSYDFYRALLLVQDDLDTAARNGEYLYTESGLIDHEKETVECLGVLDGIDEWLMRYITIDYEAMARDAQSDYADLDIGPYEFWWRT